MEFDFLNDRTPLSEWSAYLQVVKAAVGDEPVILRKRFWSSYVGDKIIVCLSTWPPRLVDEENKALAAKYEEFERLFPDAKVIEEADAEPA